MSGAWKPVQVEKQKEIESALTVLEIDTHNNTLLGSCKLGGSQWTGSLWLFPTPEDVLQLDKIKTSVPVDVGATDAKFVPDDETTRVLYADYSGALVLLEIKEISDDCSYTQFAPVANFKSHDDYATSLDILSKQNFVSSSVDNLAILWDIECAASIKKLYHASSVMGVVGRPKHDQMFATICRDGTLALWDCRKEQPGTATSISCVPLTSIDWTGNDVIAVGDVTGRLTITDVRNFGQTVSSCGLSFKHGIRRIRANRSAGLLACSVDDLSIQIFSVRDQLNITSLSNYKKHKDLISGLQWEHSSTKLWSSGWDTQVFSYDIDNSQAPDKDNPPEPEISLCVEPQHLEQCACTTKRVACYRQPVKIVQASELSLLDADNLKFFALQQIGSPNIAAIAF